MLQAYTLPVTPPAVWEPINSNKGPQPTVHGTGLAMAFGNGVQLDTVYSYFCTALGELSSCDTVVLWRIYVSGQPNRDSIGTLAL